MFLKRKINFIIKIFLLNFLCIFYTIPKLIFISLCKRKYINLVFSSKKLIKRNDFYRVNFNFDSDLIWHPRIPLPFVSKKVHSIYSIHFLDKLSLNSIENHIIYCRRNLLKENGKYIFSVKDASSYINAYAKKDFSLYCQFFKRNNLSKYGFIDQINSIYREDNKTLFDREFAKNLFLKNGFKNINSRKFDFNFDIPQNFYDSLYFIATK